MNRLTNAAKYAAIIMSLIVTVTMVSGCKKNNTDVSSELNKSDIDSNESNSKAKSHSGNSYYRHIYKVEETTNNAEEMADNKIQ